MKENKDIPDFSQEEFERFWSKVGVTAQEDKCWNWQAGLSDGRYGKFGKDTGIKGKNWIFLLSHRVAYFLCKKEQPTNKLVLHSCDNKLCCNPNHLRLGDEFDNMQDMKDRNGHRCYKGAEHYRTKLTPEDIINIRKLHSEGVMQKDIASRYSVVPSAIWEIVKKRTWKHVD